jgi:hypothetical protein
LIEVIVVGVNFAQIGVMFYDIFECRFCAEMQFAISHLLLYIPYDRTSKDDISDGREAYD